jgi:hypothetical protein
MIWGNTEDWGSGSVIFAWYMKSVLYHLARISIPVAIEIVNNLIQTFHQDE